MIQDLQSSEDTSIYVTRSLCHSLQCLIERTTSRLPTCRYVLPDIITYRSHIFPNQPEALFLRLLLT